MVGCKLDVHLTEPGRYVEGQRHPVLVIAEPDRGNNRLPIFNPALERRRHSNRVDGPTLH